MQNTKKLLHSEHFDVLTKLTVTLDENGKPVMESYCKDGIPQFIKDKNGDLRQLLIPRLTIEGNVMREWFYSEYPEGRINIVRTTPDPAYDQEKHCWCYPAETIEVTLYKTAEDKAPFANGFGKQNVYEGNIYPELPSAITIAIKNAMQNAGFGIDIDWQSVQDKAQKYVEIGIGEKVDVVPIQKECIREEQVLEEPQKVTPSEDVAKVPAQKEAGITKDPEEDFTSRIFAAIAQSAETEEVQSVMPEEMAEVEPEDVIFETTKNNWTKYNGKRIGDLMKEADGFSTILLALSDNNDRYGKFVSEKVIEAANKIAVNL